jgi:hypothetical protein
VPRSRCFLRPRVAFDGAALQAAVLCSAAFRVFLDKIRGGPLNAAELPGAVAQMGERCNRTAEVRGSIPLGSTIAQVPSCWKSALFRQSHPETAAH